MPRSSFAGSTVSTSTIGNNVLGARGTEYRRGLTVLVVEPSELLIPCSAWLLIGQSLIFLAFTLALSGHVVAIKALRRSQSIHPVRTLSLRCEGGDYPKLSSHGVFLSVWCDPYAVPRLVPLSSALRACICWTMLERSRGATGCCTCRGLVVWVGCCGAVLRRSVRSTVTSTRGAVFGSSAVSAAGCFLTPYQVWYLSTASSSMTCGERTDIPIAR